jgi:hypothetical protein
MLITWHPLSAKVGNHFAENQRSLGRYSSLADSDHGVFFVMRETSLSMLYPIHVVLPESSQGNNGHGITSACRFATHFYPAIPTAGWHCFNLVSSLCICF